MTSTQIYRVWIKATPERIWAAITDPEWNSRYGYAAPQTYDLAPGGRFTAAPNQGMRDYAAANGFDMPEEILSGRVIESDPPRFLKQTWRLDMDPRTAGEPDTTVTYLIEESKNQPGVCKLTLTHELAGAPVTAESVAGSDDENAGGGWAWVLSDLKTLLETGHPFSEAEQ